MSRKLPIARINASIATDWSLNASEVVSRRIQYGINDIIEMQVNRWSQLAKETIKDPMIWFLLITSGLFALLNNYSQSIILLLATIPLIGMDAFLHWRTQASTRSLSKQLATLAHVIRNGVEEKISTLDIVPGDLIIVNAGNFFPVDGAIIEGHELQVDESTLTGESFPVKKKILTELPQDSLAPNISHTYWGFAGTRLLTGRALVRAIFTGKETLYGEIVASTLLVEHERTPLQKVIDKLVATLIFVAALICLILAVVRYFQGFGIIDALLNAASLAMAALPDEFPVVFTFFLGIGVYRLAKQKALVRRAVSVENIGRVTCICSDKTGTITEGRFQLVACLPAAHFDIKQLLYVGVIASRTESGDPLDQAILKFALSKLPEGAKDKDNNKIHRIHTIPFTESRKRETSFIHVNQQLLIATKGSPETIFAMSDLSLKDKQYWLNKVIELSTTGYKIIACAQYLTTQTNQNIEPQSGYQFVGLLALADHPRPEVPEAIQHCVESGIKVLMITGDHPTTAGSIAKQIGLGGDHPYVVTAQEIETKLDKQNNNFLLEVDVIARALPAQKYLVVNALKKLGEIVATTGDGVNDVPALKTADIGIAMGERGTQSAREVADIVLLNDNFSSIVSAIGEGRQLFKNLKLSYKYLFLIHIPFVFSAAIIPLLGYSLLYYPIHIVWIELIIHPTSMLVFQDLPPSKKLEQMRTRSKGNFFSSRDWLAIIITGVFTTLCVIFFYIRLKENVEYARAFIMVTLSYISAGLTISLTRLRNRISRIVTTATLLIPIVLVQVPVIAKFLSITSLSLSNWSIAIGIGLMTVVLSRI